MTAAKAGAWVQALQKQGLEVRSAHDAMQVQGWLDSGNYALNWAISGRLQRGYPLGHSVEMFGDPGTGKSFLIARALAMAQLAGGVALLDDTENAYGAEHTAALGVDLTTLAMEQSRTVKEHLQLAQGFVKAFRATGQKGPGVLACDSLAQLSTDHEIEEPDKRDMTKAAEIKRFFRVFSPELFDLPVVYLAANHTIAAIGNMFQTRTTPGGGGLKFAATVRLDLRAVSKIRSGADYSGVICSVVVDKNRIVAPWKKVRLAIPFERPISRASGLADLLIAFGILETRGQFVFYEGQKIGRAYESKDKFLEQDALADRLLTDHPDVLARTDEALEAGTTAAAETEEPTTGEEEPAVGGEGE